MNPEFSDQIEALYIELYDRLMIYARNALASDSLAEEAVQETFQIACQKPESVFESPNPQGWIFNTLKFTIKNIKSSQASAKNILDTYLLNYADELAITEDQLSIDVMYGNLANTEELQILKEMAIEGRSHAEMAAKRGITISACKKRVQRAKEKLQQKLKDCLEIPPVKNRVK